MSRKEWQAIGKKAGWMRTAGTIAQLLPSILQGNAQAAAQASSIMDSAIKGVNVDDQDIAAIAQIAGLYSSATDPNILDLAAKANQWTSQQPAQ